MMRFLLPVAAAALLSACAATPRPAPPALAGQAAAEFRKKVKALGVPLEEAVRIILEEE